MTIKELILENDNFAHSEEAFEIYKESCELNVLNAWIECQEHKAFTNCDMFTEADDNALSAAKEKAEAKEEALHKKIWDKIKNTAKKVWNAIRKLIDKILRTFGVMRMPALSKEQKEALLNGEEIFPVKYTMDQLMGDYKRIPNITEDSFTALGDRGTRKIANVLAGKDASNLRKMVALQIAIWLTGSADLIMPPIIFGGDSAVKSSAFAAKKDQYLRKLIEEFSNESDPAKIISKYDTFKRISPDDFKTMEKNMDDMSFAIIDIKYESETMLNNKGVQTVMDILNRDLKICHASVLNQITFKNIMGYIATDLRERNAKKK